MISDEENPAPKILARAENLVWNYGPFVCQYCERPFNPISTRYLCPYKNCKMKNTCCEG